MDIKTDIIKTFENRTHASAALNALAQNALPGGDTRWTTYYAPYPAYMKEANGCILKDADGNRYYDFVSNYTSLIHGHRHPKVQEAIKSALDEGCIFGAPCESQFLLANRIKERMPAVEKVRFTNSGSEATMMAMRAARAYKNRELILKFDGGYHGSHDFAEVNVTAALDEEGLLPKRTINSAGVPAAVIEGTVVARYNSTASVRKAFEVYKGQIAGIIVEPVLNAGGVIPGDAEFLRDLRRIADENDALLIFDEIVTFRMSSGGIQQELGITPDITTLGKIIGGGFGIGAFGGTNEIMQVYEPLRKGGNHHSGTFNGHNVTMCAGCATLDLFTQQEAERINRLGAKLHELVDKAFESNGIRGKMTRHGSLLYFHWTERDVKDARDVLLWKSKAKDLCGLFHMALLNRGLFSTNRGMINLSTAVTDKEVAAAAEIIHDTLGYLKPYLNEHTPHLLR